MTQCELEFVQKKFTFVKYRPWSTFYRIRVNWTSSLSIMVPELWGEICRVRLFSQGGRSLRMHSNFTWTRSSPSTILGVRKLETLGYPMVKTASICV